MPGSPKGGPQSNNLKPIRSTDDPRYKKLAEGRERYAEARRTRKKRRQDYTDRLSDIKAEQLNVAQDAIESGEMPEPMKLLLDLIKDQQVALANPDLSVSEANKERSLLLSMQKQYTDMLAAAAPSTQSIEVHKSEEEELTEDDFAEKFAEFEHLKEVS